MEELEYTQSIDARLCAIILNANSRLKQNKKPFETEDFLPTKNNNNAQLTAEQYEMKLLNSTRAMGGKIIYK